MASLQRFKSPRCLRHYQISEYDGLEHVAVDYDRWFVDGVCALLARADMTDAQKVHEIEALAATRHKHVASK